MIAVRAWSRAPAPPRAEQRERRREARRAAGLTAAAALEPQLTRAAAAATAARLARRIASGLIRGRGVEPHRAAAAAIVAREVAVERVGDARRARPDVGPGVAIEPERREPRPRHREI